VVPEILLSSAAFSLNTWSATTPGAQSFYAGTASIPIVHQVVGVSLLGSLMLPSVAGAELSGAALLLPLVSLFAGSGITPVANLVDAATKNSRVYAVVPVTMKANTEPVVYITVNGGPSVPVLVDTGSSGLMLTSGSIGQNNLGTPYCAGANNCTGGFSGGLTYQYQTYNTTVDFGNGIVTDPTAVNVVDNADAQAFLNYFAPAGVVGVLGIGANTAGPGPTIPTASLPGELSDGVMLYEGLFLGFGGVMVFGQNPLPVRASVPGAPDAYLQVQIDNGPMVPAVGSIIDSGGVYGTMLASIAGQPAGSTMPAGKNISVYGPDGTLLYSYTTTSLGSPTVINTGLINTGAIPFQQGPIYLDYSAPDRIGSTNFDYA